VSDERVRVDDVIDDPALQEQVERIDYEADLEVLRLCQERGRAVPKAVWRRVMRYRREHPEETRP
jgi:hypothetical protein